MSNFWNKHLGAPVPAYQPPVPTYQQSAPQHQPQYDQPAPPPRQATHARNSEMCPECGGGNYFAIPAEPRAGKRCYECGYPKLHSTSGLTIKSEGKASPARQTVANKQGGFSMTVVGRLG